MITLFLDEDAAWRRVLNQWRALGHPIFRAGDLGRSGLPDDEQLAFANERGWVTFTCNVGDFARHHKRWCESGRTHAGIIVLNDQRLDPTLTVRALALLTATVPTTRGRPASST